jgi:hypothetical protein
MSKLQRWFDRLIERWCEALNDLLPGHRFLAAVGYEMAGLRGMFMLPVDRRMEPGVMKMASEHPLLRHERAGPNQRDGGGIADSSGGPRLDPARQDGHIIGRGTSASERDCGFWAYCHMSGQPCVWCGGRNNVVEGATVLPAQLCPQGKNLFLAWYGCCRNPQGQIKLIGFWDCCGEGTCWGVYGVSYSAGPWCKKYAQSKNWCSSTGVPDSNRGPFSYYCTVAINHGDCDLSISPVDLRKKIPSRPEDKL